MIDGGKKNILGVQVNAINYETALAKIMAAAQAGHNFTVSATAVHGLMTGVLDQTHRYRLNHLDLVVPDGQPVRWALNRLHRAQLGDRVYGPTLMLKVCRTAAQEKLPIYLYGSRPLVLQALAEQLVARFPDLVIAGTQPSFFRQISTAERQVVVERIRRSGAKIVFVGLGCPRQEVWIYEHQPLLPMPLVAVGAAFDFHAKLLSQAPPVLQRAGLEWLYRLLQDPTRLWKRYVLLNPLYVTLLLLQALNLLDPDPAAALPPEQEMRYG